MSVQIEIRGCVVGEDYIKIGGDVSIRQEINAVIDRACDRFRANRQDVRVVIGQERHLWFS